MSTTNTTNTTNTINTMTRQQQYGEYFTPVEHIKEYFSKIPLEILLDTSKKVLEPSCGAGNFIKELILLRIKYNVPNPGHNIYAFEFHQDNINSYVDFCVNLGITPHFINIGDTLAHEFNDFNFKFDLILGNPPFKQWEKFTTKMLSLLSENAYMIWIIPNSYRVFKFRNKLLSTLKHLNTLYIESMYFEQVHKYYGIKIEIDCIILQNSKYMGCTQFQGWRNHSSGMYIFDESEITINLNDFEYLPSGMLSELNKYFDFKQQPTNIIREVIPINKLSEVKTDEYNFPVCHSVLENELRVLYYNKNITKQPKILVSRNNRLKFFNDYKGEYIAGMQTFGISINSQEEGERLIQILSSPEFKKLAMFINENGNFIDIPLFEYLKRDL